MISINKYGKEIDLSNFPTINGKKVIVLDNLSINKTTIIKMLAGTEYDVKVSGKDIIISFTEGAQEFVVVLKGLKDLLTQSDGTSLVQIIQTDVSNDSSEIIQNIRNVNSHNSNSHDDFIQQDVVSNKEIINHSQELHALTDNKTTVSDTASSKDDIIDVDVGNLGLIKDDIVYEQEEESYSDNGTKKPILLEDTTAPDAPTATLNSDGSTVSGSAEPNSTVKIYDKDGNVIATATADNNGNYTATLSEPLESGENINVTATDSAGNESSPTTATMASTPEPTPTPDTTAPDAPTATISQDGSTVSGSAEPNSTVKIYDKDGNVIATTTADDDGNYSAPLSTPLTPGDTVDVTSTDKAGNESSPTEATLASTPEPTAPNQPDAPTSYQDNVGSKQDDNSKEPTTDDTTPAINIPKNLTDEPSLYVDGTKVPATYDSSTGTLTPNSPLSEGPHEISYTLTNDAGKESVPSEPINITVDITAPDKPAAPTDYQDNVGDKQDDNSKDPTTDDATPAINIGKNLDDEPKLYVDGDEVPSTYDSDTGTLTPNTPLDKGSHDITYTLTDDAGNESEKSDPINITVDTSAPSAPKSVAIGNGDDYITPDEIDADGNVSINVELPDDAKIGDIVEIDTDGDGKPDVTHTLADYDLVIGTTTVKVPAPKDGEKLDVDATIKNSTGNSSAPVSDEATVDVTIPSAPKSVTIGDGDDYITSDEITDGKVPVKVELPDDAKAGDTVEIDTDGDGKPDATHTLTDGDITNGNVSVDVPAPEDGEKLNADVSIKEPSGNSSAPVNDEATVDTTAPDKPAAPTDYKDNVGDIQDDNSEAPTTDDKTPGINIGKNLEDTPKLYVDGKPVDATYDKDTGTLIPKEPLDEGPHEITYTLTDDAGNESEKSNPINLTIDTTAPVNPTGSLPEDDINDTGSDATDNITNNNKPTLSGTAEENSHIKVVIDGKTYETDADKDGNWSVPIADELSEGEHTPSITSTDAAGNSTTIDGEKFTTDTIAPKEPAGALLSDAINDTGKLGDNITKNTKPTLSGTAEPESTIEVVVNGKTYETVADKDGNWTVSITDELPDGEHTSKVTSTDTAGNSTTSDGTPFTVDTSAPEVPTIDTVGGNDVINSDEAEKDTTLTGTAEPGSSVTVKVGDAVIGPVKVGDDGKWEAPLTSEQIKALDDGTQSLVATSTDSAGNSTDSEPHEVEKDTTVPTLTVSIVNDKNDDHQITSMSTVKPPLANEDDAEMKLSDTEIDISVKFESEKAKVGDVLTIDDGKGHSKSIVLTQDQVDAGKVETTLPKPNEGETITVTANLTDTAGNTSAEASDYATMNLLPPGTPTVVITTDADNDGYINSGEKGTDTTATVEVTLAVPSGSESFSPPVVGNIINIYAGDDTTTPIGTYTLTQDDINAGNYTHTFTTVDFPTEGENLTIVAQVVESKTSGTTDPGWQAGTPATDIAKFDTTEPSATIEITGISDDTGESNIDYKTNDKSLTINGKVDGTLGDENIAQISIDGGTTWVDLNVNLDGTWEYVDSRDLENGSHKYMVQIVDKAGNLGSKDDQVVSIDTEAPTKTVAIDSISTDSGSDTNDFLTNDNDGLTVNATLSETLSADEVVKYSNDNGKTWTTIPSSEITGTAIAHEDNALTSTNTVIFKVSDTAGNDGVASSQLVTIDTEAPSKPDTIEDYQDNVGSIQNDNSTASTTDDTTPVLNIAKYLEDEPKLYVDGSPVDATYDPVTGTLTPTTPLDEGSHEISYTLTDKAGNESEKSDPINITIDTIAPANPTVEIVDDTNDIAKYNNDGYINNAEANADGDATTTRVKVSWTDDTTKAGDIVHVDTDGDGTADRDITLSPADIGKKFIIVENVKLPAEGETLKVSATVDDAAGNTSASASDEAIVKTTSSEVSAELPKDDVNDTWYDASTAGHFVVTVDQAKIDKANEDKVEAQEKIDTANTTYNENLAKLDYWHENTDGDAYNGIKPDAYNQSTKDMIYNSFKSMLESTRDTAIANANKDIADANEDIANEEAKTAKYDQYDLGNNSDNYTNNNTPTLNITAESGSTVTLTVNGHTYSGTEKSDGVYEVKITDKLPDGTYDPELTVTDKVGNVTTSKFSDYTDSDGKASNESFTIDTSVDIQAPKASDFTVNGDDIVSSKDAQLVIKGTAQMDPSSPDGASLDDAEFLDDVQNAYSSVKPDSGNADTSILNTPDSGVVWTIDSSEEYQTGPTSTDANELIDISKLDDGLHSVTIGLAGADKAGNTNVDDPETVTKYFYVDNTAENLKAENVKILQDTSDDGTITAEEKGDATTTSIEVTLPDTAKAAQTLTAGSETLKIPADVLTLKIDTDGDGVVDATLEHPITDADVAAGKVTFDNIALPEEGNTLIATASITDAAGNTGTEATDKATYITIPKVSIEATTVEAREDDSNSKLEYKVTLDKASSEDMQVTIKLGGQADANDYKTVTGGTYNPTDNTLTLTIPKGSTEASFTISDIVNEAAQHVFGGEGNETVIATILENASSYEIEQNNAQGMIVDALPVALSRLTGDYTTEVGPQETLLTGTGLHNEELSADNGGMVTTDYNDVIAVGYYQDGTSAEGLGGGDIAMFNSSDAYTVIDTAGGNDLLTVRETINMSVNIKMGEGDDTLEAKHANVGSLIEMGDGNDTVKITEGIAGKVDLGNGNDYLSAKYVTGDFNAGAGNDEIKLTEGVSSTLDLGSGNDTVTVQSLDGLYGNVKGGAGEDTLHITGDALNINRTSGFEKIYLDGDTEFDLSYSDLFASGTSNKLMIYGDSGDKVDLGDNANPLVGNTDGKIRDGGMWPNQKYWEKQADDGDFYVYKHEDDTTGEHLVYIQKDIEVI